MVWCIGLLSVISSALAGTWSQPNCVPGRTTIVHLFEWKWTDIAYECERFLGPYGYCGVQVSPPNENRIVTSPNRPWWERYQPVSYKLTTRSGNEDQFKDMVRRCNKNSVRIYVDTVINHMTPTDSEGVGTAGSEYNAHALSYPSVPFSRLHFNGRDECKTDDLNIHNYRNESEVRNCRLKSLLDLKLGTVYVREKIVNYMNHLIDLGVAGFRVDAAKHIWPSDLQAIYSNLKELNKEYFPSKSKVFIYQEVIDMNDNSEPIHASEYTGMARVTNFIFGLKLANVFRRMDYAKWLKNWGAEWGMPSSDDVVVFIDNHDSQRGHYVDGYVLTHKDDKLYKMATAFMLAHPYGVPIITSSYYFDRADNGPPHNEDMSIKSVNWGNDLNCGDKWVCEHRWRQIYNMVLFRNIVDGTDLENWWNNSDYQIAFSRGNK